MFELILEVADIVLEWGLSIIQNVYIVSKDILRQT